MHKNEEKMWNISELILLTLLIYANGYDTKCPHSSQWNFTSKSYGCLDQNIYICVLDELKTNDTKTVYTERCGSEEISKEGSKYILRLNLDQVPCAASQYQPFTFTTNGNSQCVFSKSLCKSSGQVLANNGSFNIDRSCRCDYSQNYDYFIPPKDPCSCKPAEEDCSCYIRNCEDDKVMIADYRCMKRVDTILPEDIRCPIISRIIPPEENDAVYKKQLQPVSGSRTWSMQASVILIVVVIIFIVLIGFLFCSVPYVTSILLKSKLQLPVKRKEYEFIVLNGDNVKIECYVYSYVPVRSVTWQKERNGEIIQITSSMEKYVTVSGKSPSLTIDNFNAEDQGKYRCSVRNVIGLRTEMFGSCMHYMSRVGWLTGFVTVLQHIPVFHTGGITLHTDDIESQSKPTVYNAYKGNDITMKQCCDDQHKCIAVKWFKENDKLIELDMSNEQYSGGVPEVPSLTIKVTRMESAGKYICLLLYDNGKKKMSLFRLKIIPQVKIHKALCEHREDGTFIRPAVCDAIDKIMQENKIVVITGREGIGKSKICLELASHYDEKDYMVLKVDLSENHLINTDISNALLIIDDQQYTQDSLNAFMKDLVSVLPDRNIQVVLTCRNLDLKIVRNVPEINEFKSEVFIDINSCLTPEEKEEILTRYMKKNNISSSASHYSNFKDPKIVTDLSLQVILDTDAIKAIKTEEPWKGFPLCASLFCSNRKFLHLGEKYFTNPPEYLFEDLKELYNTARKNSNAMDSVNEYSILVYILENSNHQLDLNDPDLCRKLVGLYKTLFQLKYIPEKPGSNEDQKIAIEKALDRMKNKYVKLHEGMYQFIHPCLSKAMFLSSESMIDYLLLNGSLQDITEFVRSKDYTALENELVIKIDEQYHHILCERLVRHACKNHKLLLKVADYIHSYWRSLGHNLVNSMFRHIEFILFRSLEVHTGDPLSLGNEMLSDKRINLEGPVQFSKVTMLVDELTFKGRDPWMYGPGSVNFLILSALVSAAINRYATDRVHTFKILLKEYQNRIRSESFVKLWSKPIDIYGNTFFHYLMGLNQKEASAILSMHAEMKYTFDTVNVKKYTALDIAAFLGKIDIFKVLNLKTSNCTNTLRSRLSRLAKRGKDEYFNIDFKNKNIDQLVIRKTKEDGASPAKLEHEGAGDEKKEEDNTNNQKKFYKRNLRHMNREYNEKEKHDEKDVLCFEDFMMNVVENEKIDDYQSIIKLFQKID